MGRKYNILDAIAWLALAFIVVWLVLKTVGIINMPLWLEYSPLYATAYIAGWQIHKLETVANDVQDLKKFKDATINEIRTIKLNCARNHN